MAGETAFFENTSEGESIPQVDIYYIVTLPYYKSNVTMLVDFE